MEEKVRLDKFLWAVRLYKTRAMASQAIESGKVKENGQKLKPSKAISIGQIYEVTTVAFRLKFQVVQVLKNRVSAPLVAEFIQEIERVSLTQPKIASAFFLPNIQREKGAGRPTKKQRRELDDFFEEEED
ncbi:MAG: S4 domain-containing protein [Chitinophagales bacterium]|jgi:ribosome-associated heat shock protein Hsp15|nr:S4 domain-containing protein [Chitinophagales bacterium]